MRVHLDGRAAVIVLEGIACSAHRQEVIQLLGIDRQDVGPCSAKDVGTGMFGVERVGHLVEGLAHLVHDVVAVLGRYRRAQVIGRIGQVVQRSILGFQPGRGANASLLIGHGTGLGGTGRLQGLGLVAHTLEIRRALAGDQLFLTLEHTALGLHQVSQCGLVSGESGNSGHRSGLLNDPHQRIGHFLGRLQHAR